MTIWDDRILEYIHAEDSATPKELDESRYFDIAKASISRRLSRLAEHGLLKPLGNGVYIITDDGISYLEGELAADELPDPEEDQGVAGV